MTTSHAFAALAPAPYVLVSVVKSADEVKAGREQVSGVCAHCGSHLINLATFRGADGVEFVVGLDCAKHAGESVAKHATAAKEAAALAEAPELFRPFARDVFAGVYVDARGNHPRNKAMKALAKLGLVAGVKTNSGAIRYCFTPAGVTALSAVHPGLRAFNPETMQPW